MSNLSIIFLLCHIALVIPAIFTVLLDNRQPAKAVSWILVLVFFPFVGIMLYFFFGQNIRKERLINQKSLDLLTRRTMTEFVAQRDLYIPERHEPLINQFIESNWSLPFKDNEVEIFTQGSDFFLSLLRNIAQARHHVHIETYIIDDDEIGNLVADALADCAERGVEVRLIYDHVGSWRTPRRFFRRMADAGVKVFPFLPVHFPLLTSRVNYRNHRKITVIDGETAFIGGVNIAVRYVKQWRDTHMLVRGGIVSVMQRAFLIDWYFVSQTLITGRRYYTEPKVKVSNNCIAQLVTGNPVAPDHDIMQGYVRIIIEARRYVYMETPYFMPTEEVMFALRTAVNAGVDVRLMVPLKSDAKVVEWASRSYVLQAIDAGVKVYAYKKEFNHSKILVADDALCTCGSTNIDFRSFENNFESNIFFYDAEVAKRMKQVFLDDLQHCISTSELKYTHRPSYIQRLWESVVRLLSPLL
ncbi:MAG: cardiolipin synthase [Prevotella sp.]|uniref:cardiolipin synthase n=1 Tax=Prevotella sp. TaxID=59823 RepID=UPI002A32E372|nr:cardiolipin synthase [Prevotella sp.]MDD7319313.1 cardiolipin synthase [Prevotellaceae bacterium]MDY4020857.1 cardiolipin synthase [Prevotella sp.]